MMAHHSRSHWNAPSAIFALVSAPRRAPADGDPDAAVVGRAASDVDAGASVVERAAPHIGRDASVGAETAVTGRLAPSPTGRLHLGHARSFLLAWWRARSRGGRIVLRLEDLDRERVKPGMAELALEDLAWLGLDWDGPVHVQSRDIGPLRAALQRLLDAGLAYPCACSRKEIFAAQSAPHAGEESARYPGTCRGRFASLADAQRAAGRPPAVRFRVRAGPVRIDDAFAGPHEFDVERESGDFTIARGLDLFAYQLAVVVDDARAGVNEIVRGDDLLPSAARQFLLQEALGYEHPRWFHVPLVVDETGRRLAKRSDDLALSTLRERGVDARRVVGWIARRSGLPSVEDCTAREALSTFDWNGVPHEPVVVRARDLAEFDAPAR
jgi:glutamyl-tRNA synthetase